MTTALWRNTCGVRLLVVPWYRGTLVRCLSSLYPLPSLAPVSGDLEVMPGSLADFALEHEFDDHHYLKNAWVRDIISSTVKVSLPSINSPLPRSLNRVLSGIIDCRREFPLRAVPVVPARVCRTFQIRRHLLVPPCVLAPPAVPLANSLRSIKLDPS